MEVKSCINCMYGTCVKQINGTHYLICKSPFNYKGAKTSEINLKCWILKE